MIFSRSSGAKRSHRFKTKVVPQVLRYVSDTKEVKQYQISSASATFATKSIPRQTVTALPNPDCHHGATSVLSASTKSHCHQRVHKWFHQRNLKKDLEKAAENPVSLAGTLQLNIEFPNADLSLPRDWLPAGARARKSGNFATFKGTYSDSLTVKSATGTVLTEYSFASDLYSDYRAYSKFGNGEIASRGSSRISSTTFDEAITVATAETTIEATSEATSETTADVTTDSFADVVTKALVQVAADSAAKVTTEVTTEANAQAIAEATADIITEVTTEAIAQATTPATVEVFTEVTTEATADVITEVSTEATAAVTAQATAPVFIDVTTEAIAEAFTQATAEVFTEVTTEAAAKAPARVHVVTLEDITNQATAEVFNEVPTEATAEVITDVTTEAIAQAPKTTHVVTLKDAIDDTIAEIFAQGPIADLSETPAAPVVKNKGFWHIEPFSIRTRGQRPIEAPTKVPAATAVGNKCSTFLQSRKLHTRRHCPVEVPTKVPAATVIENKGSTSFQPRKVLTNRQVENFVLPLLGGNYNLDKFTAGNGKRFHPIDSKGNLKSVKVYTLPRQVQQYLSRPTVLYDDHGNLRDIPPKFNYNGHDLRDFSLFQCRDKTYHRRIGRELHKAAAKVGLLDPLPFFVPIKNPLDDLPEDLQTIGYCQIKTRLEECLAGSGIRPTLCSLDDKTIAKLGFFEDSSCPPSTYGRSYFNTSGGYPQSTATGLYTDNSLGSNDIYNVVGYDNYGKKISGDDQQQFKITAKTVTRGRKLESRGYCEECNQPLGRLSKKTISYHK